MKNVEIAYPKWASWAGSIALLAVAGAAGMWSWLTHGEYGPIRSVVGLAALAAVFSAFWLYRFRTARRHLAVLDAYAQKELARSQRGPRTLSTNSGRRFSRSLV